MYMSLHKSTRGDKGEDRRRFGAVVWAGWVARPDGVQGHGEADRPGPTGPARPAQPDRPGSTSPGSPTYGRANPQLVLRARLGATLGGSPGILG